MPNHSAGEEQPQCRICFDGPDPTLGRLIRPCLCSGSVRHVHLACLQRWRNSSANASAFFVCPQCHYHYRFARTSVVGLATNPVAIATLSTILFTGIVFASSFLTTTILASLDEPVNESYGSSAVYFMGGGYWAWTNPYSVGRDLVRAALRIIQDETGGILDPDAFSFSSTRDSVDAPASLVNMLFSLPLLSPLQRSSGSRDTAAVVIILLLAVGALRMVYQVYRLTESVTKRVLLRAEESILEVNA
ncbi:hypothetical protein BGW80DRAFT_1263799 [Lactifluus volemus]|nr:hypothetical protein BGW80DRAFT_1263799 [Lactifluus volemus]